MGKAAGTKLPSFNLKHPVTPNSTSEEFSTSHEDDMFAFKRVEDTYLGHMIHHKNAQSLSNTGEPNFVPAPPTDRPRSEQFERRARPLALSQELPSQPYATSSPILHRIIRQQAARSHSGNSQLYARTAHFPALNASSPAGVKGDSNRDMRPGTGSGSGSETTRENPVVGSMYQFVLKDFGNRHFDVVFNAECKWDKDEDELAVAPLNSSNNFHRMYYTWGLTRREASPIVLVKQTTWETFKRDGRVAVEDLMEWVNSMRPCSIHDYKPLLVLQQSAFKVVLEKELDFFSEQCLSLKRELANRQSRIDQLEDQVRKLKKELNISSLIDGAGRISRIHREKKDKEKLQMMLSQADLEAEELRKQQLKEQDEALSSMFKTKENELLKLAEENTGLKRSLDLFKDKTARLEGRLTKALLTAREHLREADKLKTEQQERERELALQNKMEGLKLLFGPNGAWKACQDLDAFAHLANLAQEHLVETYGGRCELTKVTYNPAMDLDGGDDADTYDDNIFEVVHSSLGHEPGHQYSPHMAHNILRAANERAFVLLRKKKEGDEIGEDGVDEEGAQVEDGEELLQIEEDELPAERIFICPVIASTSTAEQPLAEVWGALEVRADSINKQTGRDAEKLRAATKLVGEGLSKIAQHLRWLEIERLKRLAGMQSGLTSWKKLKGKTMGKRKSFWGLDEKLNDRKVKMEEYRALQKSMYMLEDQAQELDRLLAKESTRSAVAQIKNYRKPTWNIIAPVVAIYSYLGHRNVWELCPFEKGVRNVPKDGAMDIWSNLHRRVNCALLLKQMKEFDPEINCINGPDAEWEDGPDGSRVNVTEQRMKTVETIMRHVSYENALRASHSVGLVHQWTTTMFLYSRGLERYRVLEKDLGFAEETTRWGKERAQKKQEEIPVEDDNDFEEGDDLSSVLPPLSEAVVG